MMKYFFETYINSISKSSDVNNTILTLMKWIKLKNFHLKNHLQNFTFARLNNSTYTTMTFFTRAITLITMLFMGFSYSVAQDYLTSDTAAYDPYGPDSAATYTESDGAPAAPIKKPYIRYVVPFDTISELVTYSAVIDEEEAITDSLYVRAKRWIKHEFKGTKKQVIKKDDKKEFKIVMEGEFPLILEANKFAKTPNGKVVFDMEIRFKDGKYKYKINNLVHVLEPPPGDDKEIKTYFEFYRKSTVNPKGNDAVLIAADKKIISMIKNLKRYCKEPIFVDEDDW